MNHFDVVIVGAGLSGIGAACHLKKKCPGKSYVILEGRNAIGGTWDLFRYPGVRSDSDMHTLGYDFKPWREAKAIADGPSICKYVVETAVENKIVDHIRFEHHVLAAAWSSKRARWTIEVGQLDQDERTELTCSFLLMCGGYYSYDKVFDPGFEDIERFQGTVVHPQFWPENMDYAGKNVIVIGSGATAMTIVPAMAETGAQVTMVQRSPTYVVSAPTEDRTANWLRRLLPEKIAYAITRWKNVQRDLLLYRRTRVAPDKVKRYLLNLVRTSLHPGYDVDTHFNPRYNPWDQRLCLIPDDDLFNVINAGTATVVTDQIERFTETGLALKSGKQLAADIIVTATGLELVVVNGVQFTVDDEPVNFPATCSYKGMMFSDVPNVVQTFGYVNASWTLRADLTADWVCRLLNHLDAAGMRQCTPRIREQDPMQTLPWINDFSAGYMQRMMHLFPKQGDRGPWRHTQDYARDKKMIRGVPVDDGVLQFTNPVSVSKSDNDVGEGTANAA